MNWADPNGTLRFSTTTSLLANRWGVSGIPSYTLIGRDMTYIVVNGYANPGQIEEALEPVPEVEWDMPPALEPGDSADPGDVDGGEDGESASAAPTMPTARGAVALGGRCGRVSPYGGCAASLVSSETRMEGVFGR